MSARGRCVGVALSLLFGLAACGGGGGDPAGVDGGTASDASSTIDGAPPADAPTSTDAPTASVTRVGGVISLEERAAFCTTLATCGVLTYAGVGNIAGFILGGERPRALLSHSGILGHEVRRVQEFTYPWAPGSTLVLHSDGLTSHWGLHAYPGAIRRHPAVIAGLLYRDFSRPHDDVTVVVASPRPA